MSKGWPKLKRKVASLLVSISSGKNNSADYLSSMPKWSSKRMGVADYLGYGPKWSSHHKFLLSFVGPWARSTPKISPLG